MISRWRMVHVRAVRRVLIVAREVAMDRVSDTWLTKSERYFLNSHPAPSTSLSAEKHRHIIDFSHIRHYDRVSSFFLI